MRNVENTEHKKSSCVKDYYSIYCRYTCTRTLFQNTSHLLKYDKSACSCWDGNDGEWDTAELPVAPVGPERSTVRGSVWSIVSAIDVATEWEESGSSRRADEDSISGRGEWRAETFSSSTRGAEMALVPIAWKLRSSSHVLTEPFWRCWSPEAREPATDVRFAPGRLWAASKARDHLRTNIRNLSINSV